MWILDSERWYEKVVCLKATGLAGVDDSGVELRWRWVVGKETERIFGDTTAERRGRVADDVAILEGGRR